MFAESVNLLKGAGFLTSTSLLFSENVILLHSAMLGMYLAFVYDTIRIFRRLIPHNVFFISVEDILYWIYLAVQSFLLMYRESDGMLRWFSVLGAGMGIFLYKKLIGSYYVHYISAFLRKVFCRTNHFYKRRLKSDHKLLKIRLKKR